MKRKGTRRPFPGERKSNERPTGIIRTLPYFGGIEKGEDEQAMMNKAYRRMMQAFKQLEKGTREYVLIALNQLPTQDVLHCYIIVGGEIRVRANIAGYLSGEEAANVQCWDESIRSPKYWVQLTMPVSWPPEKILRRGFQGFRYTTDLW